MSMIFADDLHDKYTKSPQLYQKKELHVLHNIPTSSWLASFFPYNDSRLFSSFNERSLTSPNILL